jgi:hypothetical protein
MIGLVVAGAGGGEEDFWASVAVASDLVELVVLEQLAEVYESNTVRVLRCAYRMEYVGRENARRTREQRA